MILKRPFRLLLTSIFLGMALSHPAGWILFGLYLFIIFRLEKNA